MRPVAPREGEPTRVAIDATLREAAKNQIWRRAEAAAKGEFNSRISTIFTATHNLYCLTISILRVDCGRRRRSD